VATIYGLGVMNFHYAYNKIKGDFILTANFKLTGKGTDPHRKIGWMIRAGEQEDAPHMTAVVHGDWTDRFTMASFAWCLYA